MIVGKGDIASVLMDDPKRTYFASGVSNSKETRESEYSRERDLLYYMRRYDHNKLVYFSSLCIFYSDSRYARHKRYMEDRVKEYFYNYTIIRIGNITWGTNPHTIINSFKEKLKRNEIINLKQEYRYLVDKDEFLHWVSRIPEFRCEMNITGQMYSASEILDMVIKGKL